MGNGGLDEAGEKQLVERLKEKLLAKQRAANAVHLKEKELSAAEELCSSLKQEIQVCKAATRECLEKVDEVRSRRAQQDTPGMQECLKVQTQHAREAVGAVKQQQAHVLAMAAKAEDAATISEQSYDKFVRENTDRKQKLQDSDRIAAAADLLAKHTKAHTDKDELLLQLQVTEAAAAEKLKALRDARGSLLIAQRRVVDAENRLIFTRNCSALMGAGEFSTIKTANLAMIQATRQLMVSQAMNAGTASEVKASEAMIKKDHAGAAEHWKHSQQHFNAARSHMVEGEDSDSAAASIEALDKRMRECGWAQKFCAAMAALQAANEAQDSSAATSACRDAQQLLHSVQCEESFTMQSSLRAWTLELEALAAVLQ